MTEHETIEMNRRSWNTISAHYQAGTRISTDDVHYSPLAPGERELGLLGDGSAESPRSVNGKRIIEIGCCGGQNSIALSKWGIVNELMEAGFVLERLVEQNIEDVAKASPEELARLPYVSKFDPASQEYQILRKLPHTLIIRARKGASQYE